MAPNWSRLAYSLLEEEEMLIMMVAHYLVRRESRDGEFTVSYKERHQQGAYHNLVAELQLDGDKCQQYIRLTREQFAQVLFLVEADLVKRCRCREVINPRQSLAVCLSGETFRSLGFSFRLGATTIGNIVSKVCGILWEKLAPTYMKLPLASYNCKLISANFQSKWQFPHCVGAIDGKHVVMKAPWSTGSLYCNYKGTFSTVLLALVDANLRFIAIDVGSYGRNSEGGILAHSNLGKAIAGNTINFPADASLPQAEHLGKIPYVNVADEAFPMQNHIMRPFPGRGCTVDQQTYNYRLSRARRIVENDIVKALCVLHNVLQSQSTPAQGTNLLQEAEEIETKVLQPLLKTGNRAGEDAIHIRNFFMESFCNVAPVSWQHAHVHRGIFSESDTFH